MIVDLEKKEERGSFDLRDGGKVHLRLLTSKDMKEIRAATVKTVIEYPLLKGPDGKETYQRFEAQRFDADLFEEMKWDRAITGWDDIYDCNQKPILVTKENKTLLMSMVSEFIVAVNDGLKALQETEKARNETESKNLSIG
jgi:hypothetical protein